MAGTEVDWEKLLEKRRISIEGEESVLGQRDDGWSSFGGMGRETQELCSSIWNKI